MDKTYTLTLCGLKRELPIIQISPALSIASFVILGDTELVCKAAPEIVKKLPDFDILITAEAKGIPLVFEVSRLLKQNLKNKVSVFLHIKNGMMDQDTQRD